MIGYVNILGKRRHSLRFLVLYDIIGGGGGESNADLIAWIFAGLIDNYLAVYFFF